MKMLGSSLTNDDMALDFFQNEPSLTVQFF